MTTSEGLTEGRLENIKERLGELAVGDYYDTHDFAIALGETGQLAAELGAEVERLGAFEARVNGMLAERKELRHAALVKMDKAQRFGRPYWVEQDSVLALDAEIRTIIKILEEI